MWLTVPIVVRRPTRAGTSVDVHVPALGKDSLRDVLRRILGEARTSRAQGVFADKDAVAVVGKRAWSLRRDTDIDKLVEEFVEGCVATMKGAMFPVQAQASRTRAYSSRPSA